MASHGWRVHCSSMELDIVHVKQAMTTKENHTVYSTNSTCCPGRLATSYLANYACIGQAAAVVQLGQDFS
jgi:hypothetical protein